MKIYISADIEGVTGVTTWDEADLKSSTYSQFQEQMTAEVVAACEGALAAGATTIYVKDAHSTARNLIPAHLPQAVQLIRGWSGHPYLMLQELDETFAGVVMIGYHASAGTASNPLSHTLTTRVAEIRLNGRLASEFLVNAYTAALEKVPVLLVSGDQGICDEVREVNSKIHTVAVKMGCGKSTRSIHPHLAASRIREGVRAALQREPLPHPLSLPPHFTVEIRYKEPFEAYRYAFYPGATLKDATTIQFETDSYFEVLRLLLFTTE